MTATEATLRARRAAEVAQAQLDRHQLLNLDRKLAEPLIAAVGHLADQVAELNRIVFELECELHYAAEAAAARRTAARHRIIAGRCAACGCTDRRACPSGCAWVDQAHTLCSRCAGLVVQFAARLVMMRSI